MALRLFRPSSNFTITNPFNTDTEAQDFLKKELKVDLHAKQRVSLIQAMTQPDVFINDYNAQIKTLIEELADVYRASLTKWLTLLPLDEAQVRALEEIKFLYASRMAYLEMEKPGYGSLMSKITSDKYSLGIKGPAGPAGPAGAAGNIAFLGESGSGTQ